MEKDNTENVSHLFKPGYKFKVEKFDFESPEIQAEIALAHFEQTECMERKFHSTESINAMRTRYCII